MGPGDPKWGDTDVSCQNDDHCAPNETCIDNVCQMARCNDGPYESAAPLGAQHLFFSDRELITADDNTYQSSYWVDGYLPSAAAMSYPQSGGSWNIGNKKILDIAGGNVLGERPEMFIAAVEGSNAVVVKKANGIKEVHVGFQAIAVAAADVDQDGIDEIVALSAGGKVALCHADEDSCESFEFSNGVVGKDVTAADIDGDHYAEPVFLLGVGDDHDEIIAWNIDAELNEQEESIGFAVDTRYEAIDAGDTDGDGVAEVFALEDGGWLGFGSDHVHVWRISAEPIRLGSKAVDADSRDLVAADINMSGSDELVVLRDTRTVDVYEGTGSGQLSSIYTGELAVTQNPRRVAVADFDGNSPSAVLKSEEPELVPGEVVPTAVFHFPPHSATYSDGIPYVFVGDTEIANEFYTDTVGLRAGVSLGVGAETPGGLFGSDVTVGMSEEVRSNHMVQYSDYVGNRFVILPDIDKHGNDYSTVFLTTACHHVYKYELSDPDDLMGGDGSEFVLTVPIGGNSTIWSSKRYNAMAEAVGGLPKVGPTFQLGDLSTYPDHLAKPSGEPLFEEDLLFKDYPTYDASDVARIGWWLAAQELETNETLTYTELSVGSNIKVGGFKFGTEAGSGFGQAVGIGVGDEVIFGGAVPPIPDDPDTPEDEYAQQSYSFAPYVYRQKYQDAEGNDAFYYVLSFATGL